MSYRSQLGDVVDAIALAQLGDEAYAIDILEANPHLADQPAVLPEGVMIEIPTIEVATTQTTIRLWGTE